MAENLIVVEATDKVVKIDNITHPKGALCYIVSQEQFIFNHVYGGGPAYGPVKYSRMKNPDTGVAFVDAAAAIAWFDENFFKAPAGGGTNPILPTIYDVLNTSATYSVDYVASSSSSDNAIIFEMDLPVGKAISVQTDVVVYMGTGSHAGDAFQQCIRAVFKNISGTAAMIGGSAIQIGNEIYDSSLEDMGLTFSASGSNVLCTLVWPIGLIGIAHIKARSTINLSF